MGVRVPLPGPKQHLYPGVAELVDARNYVDPVDFEKQMKYGIQITHATGEVTFAAAASGGSISETANITNIALFVQESSAVKAVKSARKNGYERNGLTLDVVGIDFVVSNVIEVPAAPRKSGYSLTGIRDDETVYFIGPKTGAMWNSRWENIERATLFSSDADARARLADCIEIAEKQVLKAQTQLAEKQVKFQQQANQQYASHWDKVSKYDVESAKTTVTREQSILNWLSTVEVKYLD